jgi:hypothetical protein
MSVVSIRLFDAPQYTLVCLIQRFGKSSEFPEQPMGDSAGVLPIDSRSPKPISLDEYLS